jgi:hypothetical protein
MTIALGLPLDQALERLRAAGLPQPRVERIQPEKHPDGTWRVVRARDDVLTVARFPDKVNA